MSTLEIPVTPAALDDVGGHPFLRGLGPPHLEALAGCAMRLRFKENQFIFREGDPANRFYLLIKGKVALETEHEEKRVTVQTIGAGNVLGWSWLFPPYYAHFDARAIEPTDAMFFYATRLREMCEDNHELAYEMLRRIAAVVVERLLATERQLIATKP
jgi:CRP/FNR family transcriptional regulator, cyclic AMP receptor protein